MSSQGRRSSKDSSSGGSRKREKLDPEAANSKKLREFGQTWGLDNRRFDLLAGADQEAQDSLMAEWPRFYEEHQQKN